MRYDDPDVLTGTALSTLSEKLLGLVQRLDDGVLHDMLVYDAGQLAIALECLREAHDRVGAVSRRVIDREEMRARQRSLSS